MAASVLTPPQSAFRLGHCPALDGLRAISIILVLIEHAHLLLPTRAAFLVGGFLGVDVFFVISGFLITSLLLEEREKFGRVSFRKFYLRRALRLLPALAGVLVTACLLAAVLGSLSFVGLSPFRLLSIVAYFMNWVRAFESPQPWLLGHFWSLSVEEQFYSIWPALLLLLLYFKRSERTVILVVAAGIVISFAMKAILFLNGAGQQRIIFGSDTRAEPILMGCLLALLLHWNVLPRFFFQHTGQLAIGGLIVGFLFVLFAAQDFAGMYFGGFSLFAISATAIILQIALEPLAALTRGLRNPWLVWIGKRSYGIYLWHWPIFKLAKAGSRGPWVFIPLALVATFIIATASYRYIESPFLRLKQRIPQDNQQDSVATVAAPPSGSPSPPLAIVVAD